MPKRKFEFDDGRSSKFWHIEQKAKIQTVWYGRKGTNGQTKSKSFDTPALAKASVEKLIEEKLKKGYVEIGGTKKAKARAKAKTKVTSKTKSETTKRSSQQKFDAERFQGFFARLRKSELPGHPKLTNALLNKVEKQWRIKFPAALVGLLKIQNGGYIPDSEFKIGRQAYSDLLLEIWPIRSPGGIEPLVPEYLDHLEMAKGQLPKPELIFPFYGDGHFFFALDYRTNGPQKEPRVIYLDIEGKITCKKIADSFEQFLNGWQKPVIDQEKSIDIDAIDPKMIIGTRVEKFVVRDEPRNKRVTCSDWLCLNGKLLEHFEFYGLQGKLRNGKWNEKFGYEKWTKHSLVLSDIIKVEQNCPYKTKCFIRINDQELRATKGKKPTYLETVATVESIERSGVGKPWKAKRKKKQSFYFYEVMIDSKQIKSCLRKLKAAVKAAKT